MNETLSFGAWLKQRRHRLDLTQQEVAQRAACSLSTLRKIEGNDLLPSKELAQLLAVALGVPATEQEAFITFARGGKTIFTLPPALPSPTNQLTNPPTNQPKTDRPRYTLPTPLTGLVGREREIQSGCALLRRANVRLVTLIGPPGVGKTRLSLALAEALKPDFVHGVCFVPLAPIADPALVLPAIAQTLQVSEVASVPLLKSVQEFLHDKQLLLVLDNFEQVVVAAPQLSDLLMAAAAVKMLVSSREALKLYGEYEFPVPPLAVPDIQQLPTAALLEMYPAVELFTQRATAVRLDFAITPENATAVAQICAWLDGLPLAIEMAAARVKWQPPAVLLEQLRKQLMALTGGPRNLTPRQQTLRGALDWSYNLLAPLEQQLWVAIGVVNGSVTARVAAALTDLDVMLCEELLRGLVEKSLLQYQARETGGQAADDDEARYTLLQMVRAYTQAKQVEQGSQPQLQARHAALYHRLVAESQPALATRDAERSLNRLTVEHNNLRSALEWYLHHDVDTGLQLATLLAKSLWSIRGYFSEGRAWLEKFLAALPTSQQQPLTGQSSEIAHLTRISDAMLAAANMAIGQGDIPAAAIFAQKSEALALLLEDDKAVRTVLQYRASIALNQSDYPQAMRFYQQALDLCDTTSSDDQKAAATILNGMGLIAKDQGDYERALALHERSHTIYAQLDYQIGMARSLTYSSIAAYWQGNFHQAIDLAQQVITLQQGIGDVISMSYSREIMAVALVKLRRFAEGVQALEESLAEFEKLEDQTGVAMVLVDLGQAAYAQQAYAQSLQYHHRALQIAYTIGERRRCAFALEGMAMAYAHLPTHHNHLTEAVRLAAAAATLRLKIAIPLPETDRPDYEACLALVEQSLSPLAYQAAWQQGCEAPLDLFVRAAPMVS